MKKVEATGRTTDEALVYAAQQLGVGVDSLEFEIVEEGSKGFLGLGQTPTLVRAWVGKTDVPREKPEPPAEPIVEEVIEEEKEETTVEVSEQFEDKASVQPEPVEETDGEVEKLAEDILGLMGEILKAMKMEATAQLKSIDGQEVVIEIVGSDAEVFSSSNGQTLDALQYIAGIVASRISGSRRRIILDANGLREQHKEMLRRKALEYAKAAMEAGKEAVLEPQPARDRRIVHLALVDHPDVYTYSEGEGDQRHVVISPRK